MAWGHEGTIMCGDAGPSKAGITAHVIMGIATQNKQSNFL